MAMPELLAFTRMTGDLVKAMRKCPQPIDRGGRRHLRRRRRDPRHGLRPSAWRRRKPRPRSCSRASACAGADMGACGILPRIIGQGRAAELLLDRPRDDAPKRARPGASTTRCIPPPILETQALALARSLADGPWFAHGVTKTMLNQEWDMGLDDLIDAEAQAQADVHDDRRLPPRVRGVRGQVQAAVRGRTDPMAGPTREHLHWPFFDPAHRAFADEAGPVRRLRRARRTSIITMSTTPAARWCAASARPVCSTPAVAGAAADSPPIDSRLRVPGARDAWPGTTASPISPSPCKGSAPARLRSAARPSCAPRVLPKVALGRMARGLRAVGEGGGLGRRRDALRRARRWRLLCARRREDLDLQRRHRRMSTPCSRAPAKRPARAASRPSWCSPTIPAFPSPSGSR